MPRWWFSYLSEVEDHFRTARDSGMFTMSPLDWVLVESWKDAGVPLEAVLKGIDRTFQKFHSRKRGRYSTVNGLAFCTQEVLAAARNLARGQSPRPAIAGQALPAGDLGSFFDGRADQLARLVARQGPSAELFAETERALRELSEQATGGKLGDLEVVERRLATLEDRLYAVGTISLSADRVLAIRSEFDYQVRPYRRKLSAEQLASLERGFMRRKTLEALGVARLSLFYAS